MLKVENNMFEALPEPPHIIFSKKDLLKRRYHLAKAINGFVLVYIFTHKIIVPLVLSLSHKTWEGSYFGWWWIYHIALAYIAAKKTTTHLAFRLLLGFGLGGVFCQTYLNFQASGWIAFSQYLSLLASLFAIVYFFSVSQMQSKSQKKLTLELIGSIFGFLCLLILSHSTIEEQIKQKILPHPNKITKQTHNIQILQNANQCGTQSFALNVKNKKITLPQLELKNIFEVSTCGFMTTMAFYDPTKEILISNKNTDFLNIRLNAWHKDRWVPLRNNPLKLNESLSFANASVSDSILMLASDSHPQAGILILVKANSNWQSDLGILQSDSGKIIFDRVILEVTK